MTLPELALTSVSDIKVARRRPLTATAFEDTDGVPPPSRSPRRGGGVGVGEHRISVSVLARRHRDGSVFCADYRAQLSMLESIPSRLARLVGSQ